MVATLERHAVENVEGITPSSRKSVQRAPNWRHKISQIMGNGTPASELQGVNVHSSSGVRKPLGSLRGGASGWQAEYTALGFSVRMDARDNPDAPGPGLALFPHPASKTTSVPRFYRR